MLRYIRNNGFNEDLYQFYLRQKVYYQLTKQVITREYVLEDQEIPEGFEQKDHYMYQIYQGKQMIGYLDYLVAYRYSMQHDNRYVWIGLFLIDEMFQNQGYGERIIQDFKYQWQGTYEYIQLGCIRYNHKGLAFWKKMGFYPIDEKKMGDTPLVVLECHL